MHLNYNLLNIPSNMKVIICNLAYAVEGYSLDNFKIYIELHSKVVNCEYHVINSEISFID
jgi:hypothetical protein